MTQEWYSGDWSSSSIVTFTLSEDPNGMTHVELVQTGVPDGEAAEIDAGWDEYYFDPLTRLLEEGAAWA
jgi:activator of HSP90 ATPase